jgi:hypothetical protein
LRCALHNMTQVWDSIADPCSQCLKESCHSSIP